MNGFKVTELIRAQQFPLIAALNKLKKISTARASQVCKIIAVTAHTEHSLERMQALGFDNVYGKPMTLDVLKQIIKVNLLN